MQYNKRIDVDWVAHPCNCVVCCKIIDKNNWNKVLICDGCRAKGWWHIDDKDQMLADICQHIDVLVKNVPQPRRHDFIVQIISHLKETAEDYNAK